MRYYSTQRPVMLGGFPQPHDNEVIKIVNFDNRVLCPEIGRGAWGYIDYAKPLNASQISAYELTAV